MADMASMLATVDRMHAAAASSAGMDVIVVCTSSPAQEVYWQHRLEATRGQICPPDALILAVHEDWPGGAGNGLGTLYALQQAARKARHLAGVDLFARVRAGAALAIYHTAGKGQRLAPLPGSESNNKPGVKLPGSVDIAGEPRPLTILEATIRQTAIYASSRRARISVFWGDQVFVPSTGVSYRPRHHADILCQLGPMPSRAEWDRRGLGTYGLLAVGEDGSATQVDKVSYETATDMARRGVMDLSGGVGISLGSFSMSAELTEALLAEFAHELAATRGRLDSDPHFWMPLTLDAASYAETMAAKGTSPSDATRHHLRMQRLKERLRVSPGGSAGTLGAVDVGHDSIWWDYGQLPGYYRNNLRLAGNDAEGSVMRRFFAIEDRVQGGRLANVDIDSASVVLDSVIGRGRIRNSVLVGVRAGYVHATDAVLVSCAAPELTVRGGLLYNVADPGHVSLDPGGVRADVFLPPRDRIEMRSGLSRDGRADWNVRIGDNEQSYAEVFERNQHVDPAEADALARSRRGAAWAPGGRDADERGQT